MEMLPMSVATSKLSSARGVMFGQWSDTLRRIRAEFSEMPGLRLSLRQAERLLGVEPLPSRLIFDWLVDDGFLRRVKGFYVKA
jgi:hypothetical protein